MAGKLHCPNVNRMNCFLLQHCGACVLHIMFFNHTHTKIEFTALDHLNSHNYDLPILWSHLTLQKIPLKSFRKLAYSPCCLQEQCVFIQSM